MAEGQPRASSRIFISYRPEDSTGFVRALLGPLRARFGRDRVFNDTDNIAPGEDFTNVIARELGSCNVFLAVIGNGWAGALDPRTNQRRLDDPNDFLRLEIAAALRNEHITVIPVLVDRATMPRPEELPAELRALTRRQAVELSDLRWDSDVDRLARAIEGLVGGAPQPQARPASESVVPTGLTGLGVRRTRQLTEHLEVAREAFKTEDFPAVIAACERAIGLDPMCDEAIDLLQRAHAQILNQQSEHERHAERARVVADALQRARAYLADEDFTEALRHLNESLTLAPESAEAQRLRAQIEAARAEAERASAHEQRARQEAAEEARRSHVAREEYERVEMRRAEGARIQEEARRREEDARERAMAHERRRAEGERAAEAETQTRQAELGRVERALPVGIPRSGGALRRIVSLPAAALRWLGERLRQPPATRQVPDSPPASIGAEAATASPVLLGASAPREAAPGDSFTARFVAYIEAREHVVVSQLAALAGPTPLTSVVGLSPLKGGRWRIGTPVTVRAAGDHLEVSPSRQSFDWNGREQILSFPVSVRLGEPPGTTAICFEVFIEGVPIARVALDILIRDHVTDVRVNRIDARAPETAFASYAAEDRPIVTQCLSALQRHDPGLDIFVDCLDLKPNSEWQQELARVIPTKDVFFLFWSSHAMRSPWVQWELQTVKATRGLGVVCPMPLEDPTNAPPPSELAHLNFGDRYLTARDSALRAVT